VQAIRNGAVEFLTKPVDDYVLVKAVQNAVEKDLKDRAKRAELAEIGKRLATLSPREFEVLCHIVMGRLSKQIASDLGRSEKTIKVHRQRIREKMKVKSIAALVWLDIRVGFASAQA